MAAIYKVGRRPSPNTEYACILILDFPTSGADSVHIYKIWSAIHDKCHMLIKAYAYYLYIHRKKSGRIYTNLSKGITCGYRELLIFTLYTSVLLSSFLNQKHVLILDQEIKGKKLCSLEYSNELTYRKIKL